MAKYGTLTCPDCSKDVDKTSPNMKRCKPCALAAHGQTGAGFRPRICGACGLEYVPSGSGQSACPTCLPEVRRRKTADYRDRLRTRNGVRTVGSIIQCADCGCDVEYMGGNHTRCRTCQRKYEVSVIHTWLRSDPERRARYRRTSKDRDFFGGNRTAALERDGYRCTRCGTTEDLQVHHRDGNGTTSPREERNNALDNLQTLCRGCHTVTHNEERYGT